MASLHDWFLATRPKTLPASTAPVILGSAAAFSDGKINWTLAVITIICALLIQIIVNFINEIYDFKKGVDTDERLGPTRGVATGSINGKAMKNASIALIIITFALGMILVFSSDYKIFIVGILSLLFAWLYTGGPYPLSYHGIADIFVLIFFGIIAVCGTYYVQTGTVTKAVFIASFSPGLFSMNILGVNNLRDLKTDQAAGKTTLAVRFGSKFAIILYDILNYTACLLVPYLLAYNTVSFYMLIPMAALPFSIILSKNIRKKTGKELNSQLAGTGKLLLLHSILISISFIIK